MTAAFGSFPMPGPLPGDDKVDAGVILAALTRCQDAGSRCGPQPIELPAMLSRTLGGGVVIATALALTTTPAAARDYASTALNIIPSGQYGAVPVPAGADEQAKMYDGLTPLFDRVAETDLRRFFKSEALNDPRVDGPARSRRLPRRGVTLTRDRFNVPFIKAASQSGAIWGAGWVIAQD